MQKKRIKFWIIFGCIFVSIPLICIVLSMSMKLKTVNVEFRSKLSEHTMLTDDIQSNIKNYFTLGESVALLNTEPIENKIEKDYPFVKVNQIIKSFPNILRVYISERIPKYRVIDDLNHEQFLILDNDFKVIDIVLVSELNLDGTYGNTSYGKKTIEISKDNLKVSKTAGSFLYEYTDLKNQVNKISTGIYGVTEDYAVARLISINETENGINFNINMKNSSEPEELGCNILIDGYDDLILKTYAGVSTFESEVKLLSDLNNSNTVIKISIVNGEYRGIKYTIE